MADDEEVAIVLWQFIELLDEKQRQYWVHPINKKRRISDFISELRNDPEKFYNYCRMSIPTFDILLGFIKVKIEKKNTNFRRSISAEERLIITLRFLATGDRFQYLHFNFRIGASTAGKIVLETCTAIWEVLSPIYLMTELTPEKWIAVANGFEELWNYPNCCGAIDGRHIRIESPWNSGSAFYNYKNFHSIVLQAVVDAYGNFLVVDVGEPGRNSDGGVFLTSNFGRRFINQNLKLPASRKLDSTKNTLYPYVFVGDDAYSLAKHLMKPFARSNLITKERKIYNYRHSRARRIVECAFGMMVKKFRVLEHAMLVHPNTTKIITLACCALHNLIRKREGQITEVYDEMMNIEEYDLAMETSRARASKAAYKVRESFAEYFNSPAGSVPWQERMALI